MHRNDTFQGRRHTRGFSLIEVMLVLVIIGLLAGVIGVSVQGYTNKARTRKAQADIAVLDGGVKAYYADNGNYPAAGDGLETLVPDYIEQLGADPWGNAYQYEMPGAEGAYDIISFGADGREGGDGVNTDLTNWGLISTGTDG